MRDSRFKLFLIFEFDLKLLNARYLLFEFVRFFGEFLFENTDLRFGIEELIRCLGVRAFYYI